MFREIGKVWGAEVWEAGCPLSSPPQIEAPGSLFHQPQVQPLCSDPMHAPLPVAHSAILLLLENFR